MDKMVKAKELFESLVGRGFPGAEHPLLGAVLEWSENNPAPVVPYSQYAGQEGYEPRCGVPMLLWDEETEAAIFVEPAFNEEGRLAFVTASPWADQGEDNPDVFNLEGAMKFFQEVFVPRLKAEVISKLD